MALTGGLNPSPRDSLHTAGSVFFISSTGQVLKLPIPSGSPRDPLGWSLAKRALAFIALEFYSTVASFEVTLPGMIVNPVQAEFGGGASGSLNTQSLSTIMNLCTGIGYVIAIPLSKALGRRPVILGASILTAFSTMWAGLCGSFGQLQASLALQALGTGAAITMCTLIIIDMTFIHERPNALALYWSLGGILVKLAFIIFPLIIDMQHDWRTIYLIWLVPCIIAIPLVIFLLPETYFLRPPVALDGRVLVQTSTEKVLVYQENELAGPVDIESTSYDMEYQSVSRFTVGRAYGTSWSAMGWTYMQMLYCIVNPLTFWVAILTGVMLSGVILLGMTQPSVLVEKWGKNPDMISKLLGVAGIIGAVLALPATGPLTSWFTRYHALRHGGVRQAEVYLFPFSLPISTGFLSILINGLAIKGSWPPGWLYFASALSTFSYISGNVVFTLWITEAFPRWAAAALAVQLFVGNLVSFGIGVGIMCWVKTWNIISITGLIGGLLLALGCFAIPAVFYGKDVRQYIHGRFSASEKGALRPQ